MAGDIPVFSSGPSSVHASQQVIRESPYGGIADSELTRRFRPVRFRSWRPLSSASVGVAEVSCIP